MRIQHAIFDQDGTISTLREGWERIMEPMMIRAILGPRYDDADETLYHKVVDRVGTFIDRTTGTQTLKQMEGLVALVEEFGCVPTGQILDMHGYKAVYNKALLEMVRQRITKLERGELSRDDFQMKNAWLLLEQLHGQGVTLYLASGTDVEDVRAEVEALGYAHLFEDRFFGAVGDVKVEAKRMVLDRIIRKHDLSGPAFVTFGDGPVEMRETHKRGGIAVGVASDEPRRFGLNAAKRSRLIRAGADIIVPDFSQIEPLLKLLGLKD
jgi:phosphoglycolate phosphatase-like HAD superfamily hydrolase